MTAKNRADLQSDINTAIPDNTTGDVDPGDVRVRLIDMMDSLLSKADDASANGLSLISAADYAAMKVLLDIVAATTSQAGVAEIAESSEWQAGTDTARVLGVNETWGAAAEVTLTDAATIAVDMSTFINATVTLGGNRTLGNPTNEKVGQQGYIRVVQDATGSRTLSFGTDYEFSGGTAPTLTTDANAEDLLFYVVLATDRVFISNVLDIS